MMRSFTLEPAQAALLILDVQDKLFSKIEQGPAVLSSLWKLVQGFQLLSLPIFLTEQYPTGLGPTLEPLQSLLQESYRPFIKTAFSCIDDPSFDNHIHASPRTQWVVVGLEAHICVLQTAKDLLKKGREVVVLNDAIASRSIFDYSTAIAEMRDAGARISSTETILFELIKDALHPQFKSMTQLVKTGCGCC
jgi:nicotinamidase-related amidase